jgi:protein-tyrosine phosphatase
MTNILPGLYLGSKNNACNMIELVHHQVKYIVNATYEVDNYFLDSFMYKKLHWDDTPYQKLENMWEIIDSISKYLEQDQVVLVHCQQGRSRSVSVVIAYLVKFKNMTVEEALKFVQDQRPIAKPNYGFMQQLKEHFQLSMGASSTSS